MLQLILLYRILFIETNKRHLLMVEFLLLLLLIIHF